MVCEELKLKEGLMLLLRFFMGKVHVLCMKKHYWEEYGNLQGRPMFFPNLSSIICEYPSRNLTLNGGRFLQVV